MDEQAREKAKDGVDGEAQIGFLNRQRVSVASRQASQRVSGLRLAGVP